jgi:hypothetical protein
MTHEKVEEKLVRAVKQWTWNQRFWVTLCLVILVGISMFITNGYMPVRTEVFYENERTYINKIAEGLFLLEIILFYILSLLAAYSFGRK